ncbi:MAG: hypothetical protein AB7I24_18260 [Candidatus Nanopelagicales bacterium]
MTPVRRCPACGALSRPWSRHHAPHCGAYVDPELDARRADDVLAAPTAEETPA